MFSFSSKTLVNRKFKMSELYKVMGADKTVKADAANILSVTLTNVLNADTLNLTQNGDVKEIYLFEISLGVKAVPALFIAALDKITLFHTAFVLRCEDEEMLYAAYKEYSEKGMKIGRYYSGDWAKERTIALPLDINGLEDIYTAIIDELIPLSARSFESTKDFVERYDRVLALKKEIEKLQRLVDTEVQPRRRFEYNGKLKTLKDKLIELQGDS